MLHMELSEAGTPWMMSWAAVVDECNVNRESLTLLAQTLAGSWALHRRENHGNYDTCTIKCDAMTEPVVVVDEIHLKMNREKRNE